MLQRAPLRSNFSDHGVVTLQLLSLVGTRTVYPDNYYQILGSVFPRH